MVAEKTAKNFRGLLYFAAPGTSTMFCHSGPDLSVTDRLTQYDGSEL